MQVTKSGIDFRKDFIVGTTRICSCGSDYIMKSRMQKRCPACAKKQRNLTSKLHRESKK
jgi:hypothetical protein